MQRHDTMSEMGWYRDLRRFAGTTKRWIAPRPEVRAWQAACRRAEQEPRFTPGTIQLMNYRVDYRDLLTLCPQWDDLFVKETLKFCSTQPAPRILDCGANVGLASLYFKRLYPRARITAYEADPDIYQCLRNNLRCNGASDVEAIQAAVWTTAGTVDFLCEGADSGAIATLAGAAAGVTRQVPCVKLRDVLAEEHVDLLKIDIEGAEGQVLTDCEDVLANVRALLLDLHEFDATRRETPAILRLLEQAGFTYSLDELHPLPWRAPVASADSAFPARALSWALLVRAWRLERHENPQEHARGRR